MAASREQKRRIKAQLERQRRKRRDPAGVDSSDVLEDRYAREINSITVDRLDRLVKKFVFPMLDQYLGPDLTDAVPKEFWNRLLFTLKPAADLFDGEVSTVARGHVERVNGFHEEKFIDNMRKAIGVDLSNILSNKGLDRKLRAATRRNVNLIKRIPKKYLARVRAVVQQGFSSGSDSFSIKRQLIEISGVEKRHAKLIARDQTSKLTSSLNEFRQRDIGITHYIWRTVGDESVRPTHANNNRKSFAWTDPPPETGHPGKDVQCRCVADPDLTPVLGLLEEEKERRLQKRPVK